jgi:hypothetical protein
MSHSTVLVIGENPEEQLKPFQENNMGDCPKEFLEFNDITEESTNEYETGSVTRVAMPDGRLLPTWDREFETTNQNKPWDKKYEIPKELEQREVPFIELYPTFESYMSDYEEMEIDPETGKYGYWENPNAKWDWYALGGRWTGFFKLKPCTTGQTGDPGLMTDEAENGYCDSAVVADIDFEFMRRKAYSKAYIRYSEIQSACDGFIPVLKTSWSECLKKYTNIDEARKAYHNQRSVKSFNKSMADADKHFEDIEKYQCTLEDFAQKAYDNALSTFAVLKNGKWYERGDMGWWGCVSDEKDQKAWNREFNELIKNLDSGTLLSVYDVHI